MFSSIKKNSFIIFVIKFFFIFAFLYATSLAIIGLSVKGGYYNQSVHDYLDFIGLLRFLLLWGSKTITHLFGYDTYIEGKYILRMRSGIGVRMVYQCIGYGIMSFWTAFVIANQGNFSKKLAWILIGWITIYLINVIRISALLISIVNHHKLPFHLDHHTFFNMIAYTLILLLIIIYDRTSVSYYKLK